MTFDGIDITALGGGELRALRKRVQLIFQDPFGSLNPRMTVCAVLAETIKTHGLASKDRRRARVYELLGLPPEAANRYPHEFSGGQRQRIGIARALSVEPDLIVADEPVSALDVSVQAQILNLLEDLQDKLGLTYLFIGHDLSVIRHISDIIAVMYLGRIVKLAPVDKLFRAPIHPYTQALLSAIPVADPTAERHRTILKGGVPSPISPPSGCHFHPRCPDAPAECGETAKPLVEISRGHYVGCPVHAPEPTVGSG